MAKAQYDRFNEQVILASVLSSADARSRALALAKTSDFRSQKHRVIFEAVRKCEAAGLEPDDNNIGVHASGDFGKLGYLRNLRTLEVSQDVEHNLDLLRRDSARAAAAESLADLKDNLLDGGVEYDDVVRQSAELLYGLRDAPIRSDGKPYAEEWLGDYRKRRRGETTLFVPTCYDPLDVVLTEGLAAGSVITIGGRPRMGKTMLCVDMFKRLRRYTDKRLLYVAQEKGREYITNLLVSNVTGIDKRLILKTPEELTKEQDSQIEKAVNWLFRGGQLTVIDNPVRGLIRAGKWSNEAVAAKMVEVLAAGYDVAAWDIWQRALQNTKPDMVSAALDAFYEANKATGTHSIIVQQLHRRVEDRNKDKARRPTLSDLKQSGAYEEYSDLVLFVHREKVYKKYMPRGDVMEVIIGKQKLGEDGVTMLADFAPQTCRLTKPRLATEEDIRGGPRFAADPDGD